MALAEVGSSLAVTYGPLMEPDPVEAQTDVETNLGMIYLRQ